jgi:DNA-directed RNA polymerase specialized sigma24 family protein
VEIDALSPGVARKRDIESVDISFLTQEWLISARRKLITFFTLEGCCRDPEGNADEALFRVVQAISRGTVIAVKPITFTFGVAKLVALECRRKTRRRNEIELNDAASISAAQEDEEEDPVHACLRECLGQLSPFDHALIIAFYSGTQAGDDMRKRKELADLLNIPITTLRKKAMRIRQQLERCISGCVERQCRTRGEQNLDVGH